VNQAARRRPSGVRRGGVLRIARDVDPDEFGARHGTQGPAGEGLDMTHRLPEERTRASLPARQQVLPEHDGIVVGLVMGRVDKGERTFSR
jgi:hypothetical protein